jgi:hypothetical protein
MSNAVDPVDRVGVELERCGCGRSCAKCELLVLLRHDVLDLRERLNRIAVLSHPETIRHVYRGA